MRFDSLQDWLDWQSGLNPKEIELGLERVHVVWERLGAPSLGAPVLTVAGTNGKGSCAAMLESVYRAAGYRTALLTDCYHQFKPSKNFHRGYSTINWLMGLF